MNLDPRLIRHLFYWVLPALYMGALVALYFSGRSASYGTSDASL